MKSPVSIAWDDLKSVVVPIKRQFGYVMSSKSYARDLQEEVAKLNYTAQRVENDVQEARNNLRVISSDVTEWLANAERVSKEAKELLGDFERASKTCCCGTLPGLNCRYQFSRKAETKIELIQRLAREENAIWSTTATAPPRVERGFHPVSDLLRWAVTEIKRHSGYVISSESYAEDLRKEVGKLAYEVDWVDLAVEEARKNRANVYSLVSDWHETAGEALKGAGRLLDEFKNASKTWCCGTLPDPRCHYEFSTKAKDNVKGIQELTQEISKYKKLGDICPSARPGIVTSTPITVELRDDGAFESRASVIQEIMDALADSSNTVVGVYGMGGVGKSTLLVDVERRIRQEKSFHWVAKADVSVYPDIRRIQGEIAHALGLTAMRIAETDRERADLLRRRLKFEEEEGNKVLIILDNLWKRINLKSVGIPCGSDNKARGCKLLLSSRYREVLRTDMGCDRVFLLDVLQEKEARALFERMVGGKVHEEEFKPLVEEAVRRCAGLPVLIVLIAKLFIHYTYSEWCNALKKIGNKGEMIDSVFRLSYDRLGEEEKSFLQLCVVHGGSEPSLENLKKYGVSLGIFREDGSEEEARDKWRSLIRSLQDASLFLDSGEADRFKIHDLVREFVVSTASRDHRLSVLNDKGKSVTECLGA